jgi:hypothetical protein
VEKKKRLGQEDAEKQRDVICEADHYAFIRTAVGEGVSLCVPSKGLAVKTLLEDTHTQRRRERSRADVEDGNWLGGGGKS